MKLKLLFALALGCTLTFAQQIPENIKPPSWSLDNIVPLKPHKLPSFNLKKLTEEDNL